MTADDAWKEESLLWEGTARDYGDRLRALGDGDWVAEYNAVRDGEREGITSGGDLASTPGNADERPGDSGSNPLTSTTLPPSYIHPHYFYRTRYGGSVGTKNARTDGELKELGWTRYE